MRMVPAHAVAANIAPPKIYGSRIATIFGFFISYVSFVVHKFCENVQLILFRMSNATYHE